MIDKGYLHNRPDPNAQEQHPRRNSSSEVRSDLTDSNGRGDEQQRRPLADPADSLEYPYDPLHAMSIHIRGDKTAQEEREAS